MNKIQIIIDHVKFTLYWYLNCGLICLIKLFKYLNKFKREKYNFQNILDWVSSKN